MSRQGKCANGFSMIEVLVATAIFLVLAGGIFSVLFSSQVRYQSENGLTETFQQANLVMDQIVRDVHSAGYPPPSSFNSAALTLNPPPFALAFAWSPNYPSSPFNAPASCSIGVCATPGDDDLVLEASNGTSVQWIRYSLQTTTLMRGVAPKGNGDPLSSVNWTSVWTPYLENVVNPSLLSAPPIFTYFDANGLATTQPSAIHEVKIYLVVQSPQKDQQTGQYRTVTITGQAAALNH